VLPVEWLTSPNAMGKVLKRELVERDAENTEA
jgi:hypothetical protein